ncbi:hypothetical protein CAPTEDRAFT_201002 [Capitella teleta]|uniref:Uncharacterized protein n=1 Tax=Capitella teleta TaxID=283909 RepID=R7T734_CAPTE|nr:hypothetical protein CAPTEDRAFT_201002 [Capitella teleta]|eukprot:ELT87170.1 hypothetical protein CAPTEDRAFT_201002 [Capitella teleta]
MVGIFLLGGLFRFTNYIGAICGVIVSFTIVGCISVGSLTVPQYTPALPPGPIDGCMDFNETILGNLNASIHTHSRYISGASSATTMLDSIYQLSFHYYGILGVTSTILSGIVVSAITNKLSSRVREANSDIPDKYFIRWSNAFRTPPPTEDDENQQMKDWDETKGRSKENNEKADVTSNLLVSDERLRSFTAIVFRDNNHLTAYLDSQLIRAGDSVCFSIPDVWKTFQTSIKLVENCPDSPRISVI